MTWRRISLLVAFALAALSFGRTSAARQPPPHPLPAVVHGTDVLVGHGGSPRVEEAHGRGPGDINWFDFSNKEQPPFAASIGNFVILALIYYYFGKKPIAEALVARRQRVAKEIEEAQAMKREAEARSQQYAAKLGKLEDELADAKKALTEAGAGEKARIVREAGEKAARLERDTQFLLEQESKQVHEDIQREAVLAAVTQAEALLRGRLTAADQERLAEEFLASISRAPKARPGVA